VFETHAFGVMAMVPFCPLRARRSGVIVNVECGAGTVSSWRRTASKTAIEGFTGSLALELEAFNAGQAGRTWLYCHALRRQRSACGIDFEPYQSFAQACCRLAQPSAVTSESDVAERWRAARRTGSSGFRRVPMRLRDRGWLRP
jgi:NAD(P)-dependent dehydrogenase (short-subunit alcohol dehydrogenase family)